MSVIDKATEILKSRDVKAEVVDEMILEVAKFQSQNNKSYGFFLETVGEDPESWEKWSDVRPMPVRLYKEFEVSSFDGGAEKVWHSSGTTSDKVSKTYLKSTEQYDEAIRLGASWLEENTSYDKSMKHCSLIPSAEQWENSSLAYMFSRISSPKREYDCSFISDVTNDSFSLDIDTIRRSKGSTMFLYGTSYAFVTLFDVLKEQGIEELLDENSVICDTGGYKNKSRTLTRREFVDEATSLLGIPEQNCVTEYGMSELSSQFWATGTQPYTPISTIRTRVINPRTGEDDEDGVLAVYDLANVWSCAGIMTEDVVVKVDNSPTSPLYVLGRAEGAVAKGCSLVAERALS